RSRHSGAEARNPTPSEISCRQTPRPSRLVAHDPAAHKQSVPDLFDMELRALRRDRAARSGPVLFLYERVFADCLDRIALIGRRFERGLLIGCPDSQWPVRLGDLVGRVSTRDPGPLFAAAAGGSTIVEDYWEAPAGAFELILGVGSADTLNDLPPAARHMRRSQ